MKFEWDPRKAAANLRKHSVTFDEAMTVFSNWESMTIPDPDHSRTEVRYVTMGTAFTSKLLVVVHTDRGDNIRIISARRSSRRERKGYEKGIE